MFGRRGPGEDGIWINPKPVRSLRERETAASAGGYEARRVPGHLDEFRIVSIAPGAAATGTRAGRS